MRDLVPDFIPQNIEEFMLKAKDLCIGVADIILEGRYVKIVLENGIKIKLKV